MTDLVNNKKNYGLITVKTKNRKTHFLKKNMQIGHLTIND